MGLFSKKEVRKDSARPVSELPRLPNLPDFPEIDYDSQSISRLPSFPSSSLGTKFSQDTIKDAISGEEEDDEFPQLEDFPEDLEAPQKPMKRPFPMDFRKGLDKREIASLPKKSQFKEFQEVDSNDEFRKERNFVEPVFIRIDKFEEALKIFNDTRKKLSEVEETLKDIRRVKEKEEEELQFWESEIKNLKGKIEKVDKDIFSKI